MPRKSTAAWAAKKVQDRARYHRRFAQGIKQPSGHKPAYHNRHQLLRIKGMTPAEYDALVRQQNGACAICFRPETVLGSKGSTPKHLAIDHDHRTGLNRGLLCQSCNIALGLFEDEPTRLTSALAYLQKHS